MWRTNPSMAVEFRAVEFVLRRAAPVPLSPERKEALRQRIFAALGAQAAAPPGFLSALGNRWVAIPVGAGLAASILAASRPVIESFHASRPERPSVTAGAIEVNGFSVGQVRAGDVVHANSEASILFPYLSVRADLDAGSLARVNSDSEFLWVDLLAGSASFASDGARVEVTGTGWAATLAGGGVATFALEGAGAIIRVAEGTVRVTTVTGACEASAGQAITIDSTGACRVETAAATGGGTPAIEAFDPPGNSGSAPGQTDPPGDSGDPPGQTDPPGNSGSAPGQTDPPGNSGGAPGQTDPPGNSGSAPGQSDPPGNSGSAPGQTDPPGNSGDPPGQTDPPGNSGSAPGQTDPPGNSGDPPGQTDPPGNSGSAPGQTDPPGNSGSAPGQTDPPGNSGAAPGQTDPPGNSGDAPGQADPPGSSGAAPGQTDPPGNSGDAPGKGKK